MTAINGHEIVDLFGKRALTGAESQRVEETQAASAAAAAAAQAQVDFASQVHNHLEAAKAGLVARYTEASISVLQGDAYLLDTDTWTYEKIEAAGVPPVLRMGHTAVLHPSKQGVVTFGSLLTSQRSSDKDSVSSADLHELSWAMENGKRVWAWRELEATGEVPLAQHGHGAAVVGDRMVVIGGVRDGVDVYSDHMKVWLLDFKLLQWSQPQQNKASRIPELQLYYGGPVVVGEKLLVVVGGTIFHHFDLRTSCWRGSFFDSECRVEDYVTKRQVTHGRAPTGRRGHTSVRYGFSVYMVGGRTNDKQAFEQMPVLELLGYESGPRC